MLLSYDYSWKSPALSLRLASQLATPDVSSLLLRKVILEALDESSMPLSDSRLGR